MQFQRKGRLHRPPIPAVGHLPHDFVFAGVDEGQCIFEGAGATAVATANGNLHFQVYAFVSLLLGKHFNFALTDIQFDLRRALEFDFFLRTALSGQANAKYRAEQREEIAALLE